MDEEARKLFEGIELRLCRKIDSLTAEFRQFRDGEFRQFKDNELSHRVTKEDCDKKHEESEKDCETKHKGLRLGTPGWVTVLVAVFAAIAAGLLTTIGFLVNRP